MARDEQKRISRRSGIAIAAVALVLLLAAAYALTLPPSGKGPDVPGSVDRTIRFPRDGGRHNDPMEVWAVYMLVKGGGHNFGVSAAYGVGEDKSNATRLMTITDEDGFSGKVYRWDQLLSTPFTSSEESLDLAFDQGGAVDTWRETSPSPATYTIHLVFQAGPEDSAVVDAVLTALKEPVLLGEAGKVYLEEHGTMFSYVQTRLSVSGTLVIGGNSTSISGDAWIDHQWGDWRFQEVEYLRLQLSNLEEVLSMRLHYGDPGPSWETLLRVKADGTLVDLTGAGPDLEWERFWRDPSSPTGRSFPVEWRLTTSDGRLDISGAAPVMSQRPSSWEGTVALDGSVSGIAVTGRGYALMGRVFRSSIAIQSVQHIPDPEIPTDPSTVVSVVSSGLPLANVTLSYKLTRPDSTMSFGNATMTLSGGSWTGVLPSAPLDSVFEFSVVVYDLAGVRDESAAQSWTVQV